VPQDELVPVRVETVEDGHPVPFRPEQLREPLKVAAVFRGEAGCPHRFGMHVPLDALGPLFHREEGDALRPGFPPVHLDDLLEIVGQSFGVGDLIERDQRVSFRFP
jgi:hypothetical protein